MKVSQRFIQVTFVFSSATPPIDALKKTFDNTDDWLRIGDYCWILYSDIDLTTWRNRIRRTPGVLRDDAFFLCEFTNEHYSGYQVKETWEWFAKYRQD